MSFNNQAKDEGPSGGLQGTGCAREGEAQTADAQSTEQRTSLPLGRYPLKFVTS
jgi:hypothetical protein